MNKINIINWEEFKIGDLFDIHPTKSYKLNNSQLFKDDGKNPVIVNSSYNNGIGGYTNLDITEKSGIITFSDTTSATAIFYQDQDFVGYSHVQGMYPIGEIKNKWSKESLLFFLTLFRKKAYALGFDYANKFTREIAKDMVIKLPAKSKTEPDFEYMENYMKELEQRTASRLEEMKQIKKIEKKKIDTSEWGEFKIGELWDVNNWVYGKNKNWNKLDSYQIGSIPVISGITDNNGIYYYTDDIPNDDECFSDCLTITTRGEYSGTLKYHEGKFVLANNILAMPMPNLSKYQKLFILRVINSLGYGGYSNYPRKETLINDAIKLPITGYGQPDWDYMENYIKELINKNQSKLLS